MGGVMPDDDLIDRASAMHRYMGQETYLDMIRELRDALVAAEADNERLRADLTDVAQQIALRAHESAVMAKSGSYHAGREEAWRASFLSIEQALRGNWPHPDGAR